MMVGNCWRHSQASGTKLLVLLAIADAANEEGVAYPKDTTIMARARCGRSTVKRHRNALVADGEIEVIHVGIGRQSTRYKVLIGTENERVQNGPSQVKVERVQNGPSEGPPVDPLRVQNGPSLKEEGSLTVNEPTPHTGSAGDVWRSMIKTHGFEPATGRERKRWEKAAAELERLGAGGEEYERRASIYQQQHPTWAFTPRAVVGRWGELGIGTTSRPPEQQVLRWAKSAAAKFDHETFNDLLDHHFGELPSELLEQAQTIYHDNRNQEAA